MIALANLPAALRPTTGQATSRLGSQATNSKRAASEILAQLRSALANLENQLGAEDAGETGVEKHILECEALHLEAMNAVRAATTSPRSSFTRGMSAQAALCGLCFA